MTSESTKFLDIPFKDVPSPEHVKWLTDNMESDAQREFRAHTKSMLSAIDSTDLAGMETAGRDSMAFLNSQVSIVSAKVRAQMQSNITEPQDTDTKSGATTSTAKPPTDASKQQ